MAGGRGTRLAPYTSVLPKPLMPVGERAILEIVVERLAAAGMVDITLCVGYLSHLIRAVLDERENRAVEVKYVHESRPLGTAAPLKLVDGLNDTFLVMNGDILTTLDFEDLQRHHRESGAILTIATHQRSIMIDYGIVRSDDANLIIGFEEKPEIRAAVSMGIYVMEPAALDYMPEGDYVDFPDLVQALLAAGARVSSYAYDGLWFDIGRADDFQQAVEAWAAYTSENGDGASTVVDLPAQPALDDDLRRRAGSG